MNISADQFDFRLSDPDPRDPDPRGNPHSYRDPISRRLAPASRPVYPRLEVRMVRYSFPVRLFHSLLHAGLSRRPGCPGFFLQVFKLSYFLFLDPFGYVYSFPGAAAILRFKQTTISSTNKNHSRIDRIDRNRTRGVALAASQVQHTPSYPTIH